MKNILIAVLAFTTSLFGAVQTITNPAEPLHPRPDRVLKLVEVLRIPGEGKDYLLNNGKQLIFDASGNILISNTWNSSGKYHLLKFAPDGNFIKDILKQGEGPGEIQSWFDFAICEPDLYLFDHMKRKIVVLTTSGVFRNESKRPEWSFEDLYGSWDRWLVLHQKESPSKRDKSRLYDIPHKIVLLSKDGSEQKESGLFRNRQFFVAISLGGGAMAGDPFIAALNGEYLYLNTTREYGIQVFDLSKGKIVLSFERDFKRIKRDISPATKAFISKYHAPNYNYNNDIADLFFGDGHLWVETAVRADERKFHYDVFDTKGRFIDSFYINLNNKPLAVRDGFLYAVVSDAEDLPVLVKYRIDEPIGVN